VLVNQPESGGDAEIELAPPEHAAAAGV
jgi:hypothetical protein